MVNNRISSRFEFDDVKHFNDYEFVTFRFYGFLPHEFEDYSRSTHLDLINGVLNILLTRSHLLSNVTFNASVSNVTLLNC